MRWARTLTGSRSWSCPDRKGYRDIDIAAQCRRKVSANITRRPRRRAWEGQHERNATSRSNRRAGKPNRPERLERVELSGTRPRGRHHGTRPCAPHQQVEHMAAPTSPGEGLLPLSLSPRLDRPGHDSNALFGRQSQSFLRGNRRFLRSGRDARAPSKFGRCCPGWRRCAHGARGRRRRRFADMHVSRILRRAAPSSRWWAKRLGFGESNEVKAAMPRSFGSWVHEHHRALVIALAVIVLVMVLVR